MCAVRTTTMMETTSSKSVTIMAPVMVAHGEEENSLLEVSVHLPSASLRRELAIYMQNVVKGYPQLEGHVRNVLVIATCQETKMDLLNWGAEQAAEKDRLLLVFKHFAEDLCAHFRSLGYWADYADPASGLLMTGPGQTIWPEVQSIERMRGYKRSMVNQCHVLYHPRWQTRMYPASMFTNAPEDVVKAKLESLLPKDAA